MAALLFSSLVNVILFFRVIEISYYGDFESHHGHDSSPIAVKEAPISMLASLLIVSLGLIVIGLYTGSIVNHIIDPLLLKQGF